MTLFPSPITTASTGSARPTCARCGSYDVMCDAWAAWDAGNDNWTLATLFDHAFCNDCDTETTLVWSTPTAQGQ